ncbi:hypothetical protein ACX0G9_04820 [Flavitalea flava]
MKNTEQKKHHPSITVDPHIPDFSKSPFVIKKVENAKAFIAKHGLPNIEEIKKRK